MTLELISAVVSAACAMLGAFAGVMARRRAEAETAARQQERLDWLVMTVGEMKDELALLRGSMQTLETRLARTEARPLSPGAFPEWMR